MFQHNGLIMGNPPPKFEFRRINRPVRQLEFAFRLPIAEVFVAEEAEPEVHITLTPPPNARGTLAFYS